MYSFSYLEPVCCCMSKAMIFPVVIYGCENWTIKKAEHWRIDAFELWGWRRLLKVPWTAKRSTQSILKEISPEYSLELLMLKLKLKLQYFGHLMQRADSLEKTPDAGKDWRQEKEMTEDEMIGWHHWLHAHEFEEASGIGDGQGSLACCSPWGHKESDMTEGLNWTELNPTSQMSLYRLLHLVLISFTRKCLEYFNNEKNTC